MSRCIKHVQRISIVRWRNHSYTRSGFMKDDREIEAPTFFSFRKGNDYSVTKIYAVVTYFSLTVSGWTIVKPENNTNYMRMMNRLNFRNSPSTKRRQGAVRIFFWKYRTQVWLDWDETTTIKNRLNFQPRGASRKLISYAISHLIFGNDYW